MNKKDRSSFSINKTSNPKEFNRLIGQSSKKKNVFISGEDIFSNDSITSKRQFLQTSSISKKRGRPTTITDKRYQVIKPKKISPALESKLKVLEDYMKELREETGRVTFEMIVNILAEYYITQSLGMSKEEQIRKVIQDEFDKIQI